MEKSEALKRKIFNRESLASKITVWSFQEKKIVFTNGCFDILHLGHIEYLSKAADFGDILIVGLNSDSSVKKLKGDSRPISDENARSMVLASLFFVDAVILFNEETPYELIKFVQPDVLVKGSDYKIEEIIGHDIVMAKGGTIRTIELVHGYSTTLIEERILHAAKRN